MKKRNEYIDVIKGIAIVLVIIGHCIQYGSGNQFLSGGLFFEDNFFKIIYSFHMPLFMLVSGYLFYYSVEKHSVSYNIKTRITTLLIPIVSWGILLFVIELIMGGYYSEINLFKELFSTIIDNLWFLWAIFYLSFIVILIKNFFKDNIILYILVTSVTILLPDVGSTSLYKFMLPYFIIGYMFNKYNLVARWNDMKNNSKLILLVISLVLFLGLFCIYRRSTYIYTTGMYVFKEGFSMKQLVIDIYRFTIGLVGSITTLIFTHMLYVENKHTKIFSFIGVNSLGLYIISGYLIWGILPKVTSGFTDINYVVMLMESVSVLAISLVGTMLIKKHKVLNKIFLGGR